MPTETIRNAKGEEKVRLGGMALQNGVLVHGATAWACAIRGEDGEIEVAAAHKKTRATSVKTPLLRGPLKLAEAVALLRDVKRRLPKAEMPFERPDVLAAMLGSSVVLKSVKRNESLAPLAKELMAGALSLVPATMALRSGDVASYHGAEHIALGSYEHGERRDKEHERCGSHLVGPLLVSQALAGVAVSRLPQPLRAPAALAGSLLATGVATEIFAWSTKNPDHPLSRALARPGHALQQHLGTREPTEEQLEVAEAALAACLALETSRLSAPRSPREA